MNVVAEAKIVEPEPRAPDVGAVLGDLELLLRLDQAVGKVADRKLAAALEHGDALAATGEPRGGDAAAIAGADHDDVVAQLQIGDGLGQAPHASVSPCRRIKSRRQCPNHDGLFLSAAAALGGATTGRSGASSSCISQP